MSSELNDKINENNGKGLSLRELASAITVYLASAYITFAHILPQTDAYLAVNLTPEVAGQIMVLSRVGTGLIIASAGSSAAWVASSFQKK